ncbi:hypothetical protein PIB30_036722 [Stylosanthes scabra]|uniref:ADP-ribosyl cyclase/cyclic ADP-ribose hydrolase n=1 Tax=Stylosanthes scabra TaxID=79078 RepID=A0ABU6QD09_9FABA|nr:hypothetical protein [Stylosanthes scabra]
MELFPSSPKKYDVFVSYKGGDTQINFISNLNSALTNAGIKIYIDSYLRTGDAIWPPLREAIENSSVALVIFTKGYASSKWCLEELVKILERRRREGMVVIPLFYNVDPCDVRNQNGTYGEAFAKHERCFLLDGKDKKGKEDAQKKLCQWRAALTEAANISGWYTRNNTNASEVIEKMVGDVLKVLELRFPEELKCRDLVGLDKILREMQLLLSKDTGNNSLLGNLQVIGICGMSGIGKTTISKILFSQHFPLYDSVCFLENVKEASQNIESLQQKMLSEILKDENQTRLSDKKAFVVLDDVDNVEQLQVLCEEFRYASPESKLIITTRNKDLLKRIMVDEEDVYEVKTWSFEESLELFCLSAFKSKHPKKGYEDLAERAVDYTGGVPLALKVLGSSLAYRSTEFWESELGKFENYSCDAIQKVLRVSFEGLHDLEKKIFLDIAFFFKDECKDFVERILNACGFYATDGLKALEDKALITIFNGHKIKMHDLVQDFGLCIEDPGKRSRLRDIDEISNALECKNKGSDAVEGIKLDLSQIDDLQLNANAFSVMTDLRFLKLHTPCGRISGNMDYPLALNQFSSELRYLEWNGYRLKSLPESFCAAKLVEIRMVRSHIRELWHGVKDLVNLEGIDLSECKYLENLPDLSKASKLKWLNLSDCESLVELHPSVLSLDTLETLIFNGCKKLKSLKTEKHFRSLKKVSVEGCISLKEFALSSDAMESLELKNAGIEQLHSSIGRSRSLRHLNLEGLRLQNLPDELSSLTSLVELRISDCKELVLEKQKLQTWFEGLRSSLTLLHLKDCSNLHELPENISVLSKLRELRLDGSGLETLPESIKHLSQLEILSLENCLSLKQLPELPTSIKELAAANCESLVRVSTLKTLATAMTGREKSISFENCTKLDGSSLGWIAEAAELSSMNAAFQNVFVRSNGANGDSCHNYNFVKVCSPGSRVPEQFTYRSRESTFKVKIPSHSNILGMVLCVVVSASEGIKNHGARILCQCYDGDGRKVGYATRWCHEKATKNLNGDHVFVWYDALHFDSIVRSLEEEEEISFEFFVTNELGERHVLNNVLPKECGVRLIFESELHNLLRNLDLDFESKWKLGLALGSELELELELELGLALGSRFDLDDNRRKGIYNMKMLWVKDMIGSMTCSAAMST